jgi:hypothetical protein
LRSLENTTRWRKLIWSYNFFLCVCVLWWFLSCYFSNKWFSHVISLNDTCEWFNWYGVCNAVNIWFIYSASIMMFTFTNLFLFCDCNSELWQSVNIMFLMPVSRVCKCKKLSFSLTYIFKYWGNIISASILFWGTNIYIFFYCWHNFSPVIMEQLHVGFKFDAYVLMLVG